MFIIIYTIINDLKSYNSLEIIDIRKEYLKPCNSEENESVW